MPAGTILKGLGYEKGKDSPVAREDAEYPEWLWGLLEPGKGDAATGKGGQAGEGDAFGELLFYLLYRVIALHALLLLSESGVHLHRFAVHTPSSS